MDDLKGIVGGIDDGRVDGPLVRAASRRCGQAGNGLEVIWIALAKENGHRLRRITTFPCQIIGLARLNVGWEGGESN